jgi:hypothetical protein
MGFERVEGSEAEKLPGYSDFLSKAPAISRTNRLLSGCWNSSRRWPGNFKKHVKLSNDKLLTQNHIKSLDNR